MRGSMSSLILAGVLVISMLGVADISLAGEDVDANRRELAALQKQIDETLGVLRSKRAAAGSLAADLERLERSLAQVRGLAQRSDLELTELDDKLSDRQAELGQLRRQQVGTEQQLKKRLVALYKVGQVGIARALLSTAGTPLELAEKYAFLARIVRHDRQLMIDYRQKAAATEVALNDLKQLRERQAAVAVQRRAEQEALNSAGKAKKQLLAGLRTDEAKLTAAVDELRAKASRLADLVKKLETTQTQPYTGSGVDFSAQKGRLKWPVTGKVRIGFGTTRHPELGTLIDSNGLEIAVPPQTPVKSVWAGRVLYAGPLKGFGNLMVIDHGDKYYTLYAHAARFTQKVGDLVGPGDVIAFSGHDGRDAVYFEIRYRSAPVDPSQWLAPR
ncbi:MAG: peptidoglycan DD-metalloendopeptidase family protein [Desulfuromonadales bacterium]|nr:peptidoglycan DD-metalloendopeptidase family protein [Desulfuromonadales bacterium]